jgi:hypothetical protein
MWKLGQLENDRMENRWLPSMQVLVTWADWEEWNEEGFSVWEEQGIGRWNLIRERKMVAVLVMLLAEHVQFQPL